MNEYFLRRNGVEISFFKSTRIFKTAGEIWDAILSEGFEKITRNFLELKDLQSTFEKLNLEIRFPLSEFMIYYPILMANSQIIMRNKSDLETVVRNDLYPTRYFLKSDNIGKPIVILGPFYYAAEHDADDMFLWFCEASGESFRKANGIALKDFILKGIESGYALFATEQDKPTMLFEINSDKNIFGREATISYFGFDFIKAV